MDFAILMLLLVGFLFIDSGVRNIPLSQEVQNILGTGKKQ